MTTILKNSDSTKFLAKNAESLVDNVTIRKLIVKAQKGDLESRNRLLMMHICYIIKVASEYYSRLFSLSDLVHEGCVGFMIAIDKFGMTYKVKLLTYADYWVRQKISSAIFRHDKFIKIPLHQYRLIQKRNAKRLSWDESLRSEVNEDSFTTTQARMSMQSIFSLDDAPGKNENMYECTPHPAEVSPEKLFIRNELKKALSETLQFLLTPREQEIVRLRYGLDGNGKTTFRELGQRFKVSRERVRQIELRALRKMKSSLFVKKKLADFLMTAV